MMDKFKSVNEYYTYLSTLKKSNEKSQLICELCDGKEVLDIGCIDHSIDTALELGDNWLHKRIHNVAKSLTGIDILEKDAALLNAEGWDIIATDAEHFKIDRKFDVVNTGDIIEHLTNIGGFLESIRLHLKEDGIVIITTPNPFNIEQFIKIMLSNTVGVNDQHTAWIDPRVMWETARRHNFIIADFYWIETRFKIINMPKYFSLFQNIMDQVLKIIMNIRPLYRRDYCVILKDNKEG
jgi:SAM-dependent methyltransferase